MDKAYVIELARVFRDSLVESRHYGSIVICNPRGEVVWSVGDPERKIFGRSIFKPFQALPFVESGELDRFGFEAEELALSCASHSGQDEHIAKVRQMLEKAGLSEDDLACGGHKPVYLELTDNLSGLPPSFGPIFNNCSGKHAAMLAFCKAKNWSLEDYLNIEHPLQVAIRSRVEQLLNTRLDQHALDGCSAPTYALSMRQYAQLFALLAQDGRSTNGQSVALRRIRDAMIKKPFWVSGDHRGDLEIMRASAGNVIAKVGAEGIQAMGLIPYGLGVIIKFDDGSQRARASVSLSLLQHLELLSDCPASLLVPTITNCNRIVTGHIEPNKALWTDLSLRGADLL
jgi:L-asparaginase II